MSRSGQRLALVLVVLFAAVAVRLGFWQLDRHQARKATNVVLLAARTAPPLDLATDAPLPGRAATATGHFETDGELLLRNRVHNQAPGVHVVTPFRVAGSDAVIWVLRGFVNAADGIRTGPIAAPVQGQVTISGELQQLPVTDNEGQPAVVDGDTSWRRFDSTVAHRRRPDAAPLVLYLAGGETGPGALPAVEPPLLGNGPHLSYVIQWFAIAAAILAFGWWVIRKSAGHSASRPHPAP